MQNRGDFEADVASHPFLVGLSDQHVRLLADCAVRVHYEAGQVLFHQGEAANRFYLIERGEVVLEAKSAASEPVVIDTIGDGELLGWSWLFEPYLWHFTARATKPTTAIFFYGTMLREYCEKDPALGYALLKRMSEVMTRRLQGARMKLLETQAPGGNAS